MSYVQTPRESRFAGLILPQDTLAHMIRAEVGASYNSVRRTNKNTAAWQVSMGSADADTLPHIDPLRWQARDLDRNNSLASGSIDTIVDNVVATGLRPQSAVDRVLLGISEDEASAKQTEIERWFYLWAGSRDGDVTRYATFWEQQALVLINTMLSGDVFTVRRYKKRVGSLFGTCTQLVEADRCQTPAEKQALTDRVFGGVEIDADGEAKRYHFLREHPGDAFLRRGVAADPNAYTPLPAYDSRGVPVVLHHFVRRRPDQRRGASLLAPVMEPFKQLGRFTEAALQQAVVASMFSVFVKTAGTAGSGILPGTIPGQIGGQQVTPTGTGLTKLQSGMIMDLAPGEEVAFANPSANAAFEPFADAIFKHIGVGLGLPKEVMLKHFTASYSASRAAIMEAWKSFRRRRQWLGAGFCQPVYEWVIAEAVAQGYLDLPGFFDSPIKRAAWLGATWRGAPMGQLDPLKEAKAAREWLSIPGALTIQQMTAEQFGTDYEDNLAQTGRERQQIAALPPDPLAPPAPAGPADAPAKEDE